MECYNPCSQVVNFTPCDVVTPGDEAQGDTVADLSTVEKRLYDMLRSTPAGIEQDEAVHSGGRGRGEGRGEIEEGRREREEEREEDGKKEE